MAAQDAPGWFQGAQRACAGQVAPPGPAADREQVGVTDAHLPGGAEPPPKSRNLEAKELSGWRRLHGSRFRNVGCCRHLSLSYQTLATLSLSLPLDPRTAHCELQWSHVVCWLDLISNPLILIKEGSCFLLRVGSFKTKEAVSGCCDQHVSVSLSTQLSCSLGTAGDLSRRTWEEGLC